LPRAPCVAALERALEELHPLPLAQPTRDPDQHGRRRRSVDEMTGRDLDGDQRPQSCAEGSDQLILCPLAQMGHANGV
jgi:hypothetical protein